MNPAELRALVASLPERSTTTDMVTADVVNLAFIGSQSNIRVGVFHTPDGKRPTPLIAIAFC